MTDERDVEVEEENEDRLWTLEDVARYLCMPFDSQSQRIALKKIVGSIPCIQLRAEKKGRRCRVDRLRWIPAKVKRWARDQQCSAAAAPTGEEAYRRA